MNTRQRFRAALRFESTDRPFRWETLGMWTETLDRWYAEGLDPALKTALPADWGAMRDDEYERVLVREFALDRVDYLRGAIASGYTDTPFYPGFEREVLSDDGHTRVVRDVDGITKRELSAYSTSSMPQFLRYPVENRADFMRLLPRLDPDTPERVCADYETLCRRYAQRDFPAGLTICGALGHPRNLLGIEALSIAYYDAPALIHEIMEHWTEFYCRLATRAWRGISFDFVLIWEDMAYKNGSLISPRLVREFMLLYYKRFIDHVRGLGCDIIIVDSDGDVTQLAPLFIEVGVNVMLPFEVQAGMDVRAFRKRYGRNLALIGGLDKRSLTHGRAAIDAEIELRVPELLAGGGYIPCLDHTCPPDVSLSAFRYFLERVRSLPE